MNGSAGQSGTDTNQIEHLDSRINDAANHAKIIVMVLAKPGFEIGALAFIRQPAQDLRFPIETRVQAILLARKPAIRLGRADTSITSASL